MVGHNLNDIYTDLNENRSFWASRNSDSHHNRSITASKRHSILSQHKEAVLPANTHRLIDSDMSQVQSKISVSIRNSGPGRLD